MAENGFSFPLKKQSGTRASNPNDILGSHLRELLDLLVPLRGPQELKIDGFKLLNNRATAHPLYSNGRASAESKAGPVDLYEPRIGYIRKLLESLLNLIDLEKDGQPVSVDGFRLKDLNQWLAPGGGANDILAHAASRCNLNCRFCYNKGAPPTLKPDLKTPEAERDEILKRIDHFIPSAGLNLFPNMGSPAEPLAHPYILEILRALRRKTGEPLRIPSNGSTLSRETIQALAELKPVSVDVSLNSASPSRRAWLMADPEPQIALDSLTYLKEAGIPYTIVIVPWPFPSVEAMIEDLQHTILFAAKSSPALIQVSLPGYSRHFSSDTAFSLDEVWPALRTACRNLRGCAGAPIVIRPGLFEEYNEPDRLNDPFVIGVIQNSPAHLAGLCQGDRILKVNGLPVKNRWQARSLLTVLHKSELHQASLSIDRNGDRFDLDLDLSEFDYPYAPETATHLGAVFSSSGVPEKWFDGLNESISRSGARDVLLLTSTLVRPYVERFMSRTGFSNGAVIHLRVPENAYFGGNIQMGDLMVVQDFIEAVDKFVNETKIRPDLVIVPSSPFNLSGWGRDLTGRVYLEIERHTGIPVTLAECDPIFD